MRRTGCGWAGREEVFEGYVRGALGPEERDAFEEHYFECPVCFDRLHTFLALQAELRSSPAEPRDPRPAHGWPWRWVLAPLAGSIVLVLAAALWFKAPPLPTSPAIVTDAPPAATPATVPATPAVPPASSVAPTPVPAVPPASPRAAVRNSATPASAVVLLSPPEEATLPPGALVFNWRAVPGAAYYELHIVTEEGNVVWSGKVEATSTTLPEGHGLEAGRKYFVWVRAHLSGGGTVKSPAVSFRVGGQ